MFGIDPKVIDNLAILQTQIQAFMVSSEAALKSIEDRVMFIQEKLDSLEKEKSNG